ncbi:MAG: DoxX family protein [Nanoarchaeota archaeon]
MSNTKDLAMKVNWLLLGLLMLVAGLVKLFIMKPSAVVGMLSGMGFPAATFFAWILILSEIVFGALILAKWKLKYTVIPPMIILIIAAFATNWGNWAGLLLHLLAASNYWVLGSSAKK